MREGEVWRYKLVNSAEETDYFVLEWADDRGRLVCLDNSDDNEPFPYDRGSFENGMVEWRLLEDHTEDVAIRPYDLVKCPECDTPFILKDHYLCEECRYATSA